MTNLLEMVRLRTAPALALALPEQAWSIASTKSSFQARFDTFGKPVTCSALLLQVEAAEAKGKVIILLYALWLHAACLHMLQSHVLHEPLSSSYSMPPVRKISDACAVGAMCLHETIHCIVLCPRAIWFPVVGGRVRDENRGFAGTHF